VDTRPTLSKSADKMSLPAGNATSREMSFPVRNDEEEPVLSHVLLDGIDHAEQRHTGPRRSSRFTILRSGVRQSIESIVSCAAWMTLAKTPSSATPLRRSATREFG
jgi:hypothetical protein